MYSNVVFERRQLDYGGPDDGVLREPPAATQKRVSGARATPARRLRHYATHTAHMQEGKPVDTTSTIRDSVLLFYIQERCTRWRHLYMKTIPRTVKSSNFKIEYHTDK